jgi:hypothetical protein
MEVIDDDGQIDTPLPEMLDERLDERATQLIPA